MTTDHTPVYPRLVATTWEVPKEDARAMMRMQTSELLSRMPGVSELLENKQMVKLAIDDVAPSDREGYVLITMSIKLQKGE